MLERFKEFGFNDIFRINVLDFWEINIKSFDVIKDGLNL